MREGTVKERKEGRSRKGKEGVEKQPVAAQPLCSSIQATSCYEVSFNALLPGSAQRNQGPWASTRKWIVKTQKSSDAPAGKGIDVSNRCRHLERVEDHSRSTIAHRSRSLCHLALPKCSAILRTLVRDKCNDNKGDNGDTSEYAETDGKNLKTPSGDDEGGSGSAR